MKTLLITTALVGLMSAHAQAPVTLDESAIGTWCRYAGSEKSGFYQREVNPPKNKAPCKGEDWMIVKWDGYEGGEFSCKSTSVEDMNDVKPNSKHYRIAYRCRGEGSSWREKCIMFLPHIPGKELDGKLIIHCEK
jgi:hypothetical protein